MSFLRQLWATEPARVIAVLAAVVVFVAAKLGLVVSEQDVLPALAIIVPILLGGEAIRAQVTPPASAKTSPVAIPVDTVSKP